MYSDLRGFWCKTKAFALNLDLWIGISPAFSIISWFCLFKMESLKTFRKHCKIYLDSSEFFFSFKKSNIFYKPICLIFFKAFNLLYMRNLSFALIFFFFLCTHFFLTSLYILKTELHHYNSIGINRPKQRICGKHKIQLVGAMWIQCAVGNR